MLTDDYNITMDVLQNSKCRNCVHRLTRVIEPITAEDIEYYCSLVDMEMDDDYDLFIEQHKCLLTGEDLDGIIVDCSKFEPSNKYVLLHNYKF
jgi:hypothetical protein